MLRGEPAMASPAICNNVALKTVSCKTTVASLTKGCCLGLGLGLGIYGPIAVVGICAAGGYYYWKKAVEMLD